MRTPGPSMSVLVPFAPSRPEQILPYAAMVQWTAAHRLWQGQTMVFDPHLGFAHAAAAGFRVPTGTGVTLMPFRHPVQAAMEARSVAAMTGHPTVAGVGAGARGLQSAVLGAPYDRPLDAVREYLTGMRAALAGPAGRDEESDAAARYHRCGIGLVDVPTAEVEIGLGVLRDGAARVAGAHADVAITWLTPPAYLREVVVPATEDGARGEGGGRARPRVAAIVPVALSGPGRDPVELALLANSGHLSLPHYVAMLRRAGIDTDPSDLPAGARALIDGGAFLHGTAAEVAVAVKEYWAAGVDEVVLNLTGVALQHGHAAALGDMEALVGETLR